MTPTGSSPASNNDSNSNSGGDRGAAVTREVADVRVRRAARSLLDTLAADREYGFQGRSGALADAEDALRRTLAEHPEQGEDGASR